MNKKKQQMLGNLEIAAFCDQLSMIVSAGIPIYEGISILQEDAPEEDTAEILSVISNSGYSRRFGDRKLLDQYLYQR